MNNIIGKVKGVITWMLVVGIILGGIAGYLYYRFVGCSSGSCPITSNPISSIVYGMLFGGLMAYKKPKNESK
ncbi:MAG: hypothetical protein JW717_08080 [Marinilabiliaceae bacterium]|nr:hypothetical protein [Marinilabiliaceae bacterium]